MTDIFLKVLQMSLCSSAVILLLLVARLVLRKAPKSFSYILWAIVLLRLIVPVLPQSTFSLFNLQPEKNTVFNIESINFNSPINKEQNLSENTIDSTNQTFSQENISTIKTEHQLNYKDIFSIIWLIGIIIMLSYCFLSVIKLRRILSYAVRDSENIFITDKLETALVFGVIIPKIYLPSNLSHIEKQHILMHERTHIKHKDNVWRLLACLVLCVHWFNPLVWVAYFLSSKDMEMCCDECVIKKLGMENAPDYSLSLLHITTGKQLNFGSPVSFGEGDTKNRVKNALDYKKPKFWVIIVTIIAISVTAAITLTDERNLYELDPKVVGVYYGADRLYNDFANENTIDYAIGVDKYGMPIFKYPNAAYKKAKKDFADGFSYLRKEFHLFPLCKIKSVWEMYGIYGWQTTAKGETAEQCRNITTFFDVYENSFMTEEEHNTGTPSDIGEEDNSSDTYNDTSIKEIDNDSFPDFSSMSLDQLIDYCIITDGWYAQEELCNRFIKDPKSLTKKISELSSDKKENLCMILANEGASRRYNKSGFEFYCTLYMQSNDAVDDTISEIQKQYNDYCNSENQRAEIDGKFSPTFEAEEKEHEILFLVSQYDKEGEFIASVYDMKNDKYRNCNDQIGDKNPFFILSHLMLQNDSPYEYDNCNFTIMVADEFSGSTSPDFTDIIIWLKSMTTVDKVFGQDHASEFGWTPTQKSIGIDGEIIE